MKTLIDKKKLIQDIKNNLANNSNLKDLLFKNHTVNNQFQLQVMCKCGKSCGVSLPCKEYFDLVDLINELLAFEE